MLKLGLGLRLDELGGKRGGGTEIVELVCGESVSCGAAVACEDTQLMWIDENSDAWVDENSEPWTTN